MKYRKPPKTSVISWTSSTDKRYVIQKVFGTSFVTYKNFRMICRLQKEVTRCHRCVAMECPNNIFMLSFASLRIAYEIIEFSILKYRLMNTFRINFWTQICSKHWHVITRKKTLEKYRTQGEWIPQKFVSLNIWFHS